MSTILEVIDHVHSLRNNIRDPKIPTTILKSIDNIHTVLSKSSQNGWKKVEWRMPSSTEKVTQSSQHSSHHSSHHSSQHSSQHSSHHSSHQSPAFGNRNKYVKEQVNTPLYNSKSNDSADIIHRTPIQKYVSKFKKSSDKVEDTILYTILRGKLNKFSQSNYSEIKEFITHIIDGGQTDMIKCFMKLVFEKAASEEIFCPLYAKLLSELSLQYPVLLTEMQNLYSQYMDIFEEVETNTESYNEICQRNIEKKYRRGYSQFLAELIKHNVIDTDTFIKIITKIISQIERNLTMKESIKLIEEFADCLMKIVKAIHSYSIHNSHNSHNTSTDVTNTINSIRSILKNEFEMRIKPLSMRNNDMIGLSNKARFTFLDLYEAVQKF
jgi:hypothetical protein